MYACGPAQSTFVTVPVSVIGLFASNSDENGWCAKSGKPAMNNKPAHRALSFPFDTDICNLLLPQMRTSKPRRAPDLPKQGFFEGARHVPRALSDSDPSQAALHR